VFGSGRSLSIKHNHHTAKQNKSLYRNGNPLEQKQKLEHHRSSPPIACPTRSRTEEHLCGDSTAIWTNSPCGESPVFLVILWDAVNSAADSACLARWSFQVGISSGARHRHIAYERHSLHVTESTSTSLGVFRRNDWGAVVP